MSNPNVDQAQARAAAQTILARIQSDTEFRNQILEDPLGTLQAVENAEDLKISFIKEGTTGEVEGYGPLGSACSGTTVCLCLASMLQWCGEYPDY